MDQKSKYRFFLSLFFFLSGFCFSTWASRIPTLKAKFDFNDAELGTILLSMPISSLIGLPISGWLIARYDSRIPLTFAFLSLSVALLFIGFANTPLALIGAISLFAFSMRILNIAMNTQTITLQKMYDRKIIGSFHGLWSTGGIVGVALSTILLTLNASVQLHLLLASFITFIVTLYAYRFLIQNDRSSSGNKLVLGKPDVYIIYLGLLIFFAAVCEGGMFDWSGIYFKEIVKEEIFTWGYFIFMICMAISRFASDRLIESIGMEKTYIASASFIFFGVSLAILLPSFWPSMIGFCLVGLGTASIFPMTYSLAGTSKKYSPGMAISIIATYGIVGMLIGPPLIGYLAHAFNLRISFILFALSGLILIPISQLLFKHQRSVSGVQQK